MGKLEQNDDFYRKTLFTDEAHFSLNGYVNKQNCRIWAAENPKAVHTVALHPDKVTVWCAFSAAGVIGPYFFENENGQRVTVNGNRYRNMIANYFFQKIGDTDMVNMWFQQDGATCHTAAETINLLKTKFGNAIISKNGPVNWPPRSCDLTPLDFFLWGYIKSH